MVYRRVRVCRPVTVLPVVGKIYEKLLSKQITNFMDPILSDNLTAYRKSHSCETTLIRLVEEWKMELDCGKLVGMLSIDMSKHLIHFTLLFL